jgi:hypothetical protein
MSRKRKTKLTAAQHRAMWMKQDASAMARGLTKIPVVLLY